MNQELVNPEVLKALNNKELLEKSNQYYEIGRRKDSLHFYSISRIYLQEYKKRSGLL